MRDDDVVMDALLQHIAPLVPAGATLTLICCDGEHQTLVTNDSDVEDLVVGIAEMLSKGESKNDRKAGRKVH